MVVRRLLRLELLGQIFCLVGGETKCKGRTRQGFWVVFFVTWKSKSTTLSVVKLVAHQFTSGEAARSEHIEFTNAAWHLFFSALWRKRNHQNGLLEAFLD